MMARTRTFPKRLEFVPYTPPLEPNSTGQEGRANTARTPLSVEVIDLTDLADGSNHGMSDSEDGASTIVDPDIDSPPSNALQTAGSAGFTALRSTPQENMCGESSSQPAPSEGSGQKKAIVIKDCQRESDTNTGDKDCPLENDKVTQIHGGLEDPGTSTSDHCGGEHSPAMENAIHSTPDEEHTSQASGLPPLGSTAAEFNAAMQEGGSSLLKADIHQPQQPIYKKADRQDSRITSSNNGSDGDVDDNNGTHTRKRKALSSRSSDVKPLSDDSGDRGIPVLSNKRQKSGSRPRMDKHIEYEVKQIVDVRIDEKTGFLQYHVEWVGYKHDWTWYNASNFKNSPRKLNDFHKANPTRPGPPKRLDVWLKCWEDTADHSDDNKPQ